MIPIGWRTNWINRTVEGFYYQDEQVFRFDLSIYEWEDFITLRKSIPEKSTSKTIRDEAMRLSLMAIHDNKKSRALSWPEVAAELPTMPIRPDRKMVMTYIRTKLANHGCLPTS